MKILVSAYACEPNRGSEPGVGWNVVRELSRDFEIWVLTRENNRAVIEKSGEGWVSRVHWIFVDPPKHLTCWKVGSRGLFLFYLIWQAFAFGKARDLCKAINFDIVHHLTFGSILPLSPMVWLGIPFVSGPLGGGESAPDHLLSGYSARFRWRYACRRMARRFALQFVGRAYRRAAWCLAANEQTKAALESVGVTKVSVLHQSGISSGEMEKFSKISRGEVDPSATLDLVAASRLVSWKAIDLAIDAVSLVRKKGYSVHLTILQDGPEMNRLAGQVDRLGLSDCVTFCGRLESLTDAHERIANADALIHPAFQEAFGQVCLESLALGVPVICLDWAGPGMIVDLKCGYKIPVGSREDVVNGLADACQAVLQNRANRAEVARYARQRAAEFFDWKFVSSGVKESYLAAQRQKEVS